MTSINLEKCGIKKLESLEQLDEYFISRQKVKEIIEKRIRCSCDTMGFELCAKHRLLEEFGLKQLTPLLETLLVFLSTPAAMLEKVFAVDSTGISTFELDRWRKVRTDFQVHHKYLKLHTMIGTKTKIIVAGTVTHGTQNDSPMLIPLLQKMSPYFVIDEMTADAAYLSRENAQAIEDKGGTPYFAIKKNITAKSKGHYPAWNRMVNLFRSSPELYKEHYHQRSNVEAQYSMMKRKIWEYVASRNHIAQVNEALCIAICHNLFVLSNLAFCDGMPIKFKK